MTCTSIGGRLWLLTLVLPSFACGARDSTEGHSTMVATQAEPAYPFEPAPTQTVTAAPTPPPPPMATGGTEITPAIDSPPPPDGIEPEFVLDVPELEPGCFDTADVPACSAALHPPAPPVELSTAEQLGAGYVFTMLSGGIALARNGNDWRAVLFGPRDELRIIVLKPPQINAEFEVLAVARDVDRAWALAEVGGKLTLFEFTTVRPGPSEPMLEQLALPGVDARLRGLTHLNGQLCLYGDGLHCFDEQRSSWTTTLPDESVLDVDHSLLLTESGQVYRLHWRDDEAVWQPAPSLPRSDSATRATPVLYQRVNNWGAFNSEGYLLHTFADVWLQCQQLPAGLGGSTDGFWIDTSGSVYTPTYSATRQRCKTSLKLEDFIDDDDQSCGLSQNWIVLTKTTLWAITGALRCAIG